MLFATQFANRLREAQRSPRIRGNLVGCTNEKNRYLRYKKISNFIIKNSYDFMDLTRGVILQMRGI